MKENKFSLIYQTKNAFFWNYLLSTKRFVQKEIVLYYLLQKRNKNNNQKELFTNFIQIFLLLQLFKGIL